jgi:hypothetical protein
MLCGTHAAMVLLSCRYRKSWIYKAMWVGGSATSECISAPELAWKKRMFPSADPAKWQYITTPSFPTLQQIRECVISDFYSDTCAWVAGWRWLTLSDGHAQPSCFFGGPKAVGDRRQNYFLDLSGHSM